MDHDINVKIVIEVSREDHREVHLHADRLTGGQIKAAAGLTLDTKLAVRRGGELDDVANEETLNLKNDEHFVVIHEELHIHIVIEVSDADQRNLDFHERRVTGRQIKEAAGLPLEDRLVIERGARKEVSNDETITIKDGEHFSVVPKQIILIVNGKEKPWQDLQISYRQVVELWFGPRAFDDPKTIYDVKYSHGPHSNPKGSMVDGDTVFVKNRMIFNETPTGQS